MPRRIPQAIRPPTDGAVAPTAETGPMPANETTAPLMLGDCFADSGASETHRPNGRTISVLVAPVTGCRPSRLRRPGSMTYFRSRRNGPALSSVAVMEEAGARKPAS